MPHTGWFSKNGPKFLWPILGPRSGAIIPTVVGSVLTAVCLQVLGIFFGSKASKKIYEIKTGKAGEKLSREETVLQLIKDKGKVTRKEIIDALKISESAVGRILDEMEAKKQIQQVGERKAAYYILPTNNPL